ncbi:recombinase family protein [Cohnella abietis]|uniref:Integrase n=1 Tax=Cohnella abietis TaxID=2507935 RepID=A0A3T1D1N8_9BACL|nr:recombinase family protein [Cohnella abietis]BBI32006.1 integrase [Cohnella abietis]
MRVVLYIRVSTEEQANEGYSIRAQKNQLIDYCRVNGYEIVKICIDDGYSAKNTKRPRLQEVLTLAQNKEIDAVVVYKLDRFTRSVKDLYELLEDLQSNGVGFISRQEKFDTTTAMGRAMIGILGVFAQFERELIAERVRLGMEQKVKEGKRPGGKYPFGYTSTGLLIGEEANYIKMVRSLYMSGMSYQAIAAQMFNEGIVRRNGEWTATNVALTLENPFYAGIIRFGSKMANGKYPQRKREERVDVIEVIGSHEAIWTVEEFKEHILRMRRRSNGGNSRKAIYWFNGVLRCGRCGASMYGRSTTKRSRVDGKELLGTFYWCAKRKENKSCNQPMFRQKHVEHLIKEHIKNIRVEMDQVKEYQTEIDERESEKKKEVAKLKRELEKVKSRIKKWQYAFAEDLIDENDLRLRMDEEHIAEQGINNKLELVTGVSVQTPDQLFQLIDLWDDMNDIEKQQVIGVMFDRIVLITEEENVKGVKNAYFPATVKVSFR